MQRDPDIPASVGLTATAIGAAIEGGRLSAEDVTRAFLDRVAEREATIGAFAFVDPAYAIEQARALDARRAAGLPLGALHGVPVGIKDIIDTYDMPTENGTVLHAGRRPLTDATVVSRLREAGAVIFGKTVTTELATYAPGKTRNPRNPAHTPGGSSSGSAAAVAAGMLPVAVGTQTNGSVIRPAAFCGVVGFKPTAGLISRHGILRQSPVLDQVGVLGATLEDVALLAECLIGFDENDPLMRPQVRPRLVKAAREAPPMPPRLAFVRTPAWNLAGDETREAFAELLDVLGDRAEEFSLPESFADAWEWHRTIMEADLARNFRRESEAGSARLSASLNGQIERGRAVRAVDYADAIERIPALAAGMAELYDRYDAILTPSAPGPAPAGLDSTGNPAFCTLWTLAGMPALNLPLLTSETGLPIGVQLVGFRGDDGRLLRTARWLERHLAAAG